jgi:hypothetical protein
MTPPVWRMRAHVDTWTPPAMGARARISKEAGPYADMPKDGVWAVFWNLVLITGATSFGC